MKNIFKISAILFVLHVVGNHIHAQNNTDTSNNSNAISLLIPQLNELIDSALAHNGMVNYRKLEIEAKESNLKYKRQYWTTNFGVQADTRYGTFNNFSSISGDNSTINLASNTQQLNYNVGLYLKIPVFDILEP